MFGAYVKENRKALIALAVYTVVFALVFWLYRLPLGAAGYAALVCLFLLLVWFAVDYRRCAASLRLLRRLEPEGDEQRILGELTWAAGELTELRRGLEQESRQREKLWFAGLFSGAGLLLILLI